MKIKFFDYMTVLGSNNKTVTRVSGLDTKPLAHSICGKRYYPVGILGSFEAF